MIRILSAALALCACAHAYAATCTWTGAGSDDKWSTAANWNNCAGIRPVPVSTDTLVFPDTVPTADRTNTNDIVNLQPAALQFTGLNYDISGNAITLTPGANSGITVNTPAATLADHGPRFRPDIKLGGTQTFSCAAGGSFLFIDGALNLNGKDLGIDGSCNTSLRGAVSGSGDIKKFGTGFLYFSQGPYSYGGIVTVNNGTAYVGTDSGLGATASSTYVESGATLSLYLGVTTDESLFVNGGTLENFIGDNTVTGDVTFSGSSKVDVATDTTLTINGHASFGFIKKGAGTVVLNDADLALSVDDGTVEATGTMGPVSINPGGTFIGSGALDGPLSLAAAGILQTGTRATPGTLTGLSMSWDAIGYFRARLGKKSDRLVLAGSLAKFAPGFAQFLFRDGVTPPTVGVEYTLVEYAVQSGFEVPTESLAYSYVGTGPGASLTGSFNVSATKITFTVSSVVSDLLFRDGVEP